MKKIKFALVVMGALALAGCETTSNINTNEPSLNANSQQGKAAKNVAAASGQFKEGNYGLAQKGFLEAVEATPRNSTAWLGLAASYDQLGRFDLAEDAYKRLLQIEGRKPAILNNYGYSHVLRGNMKKARSLMNEARSQAPLNAVIEGNWKLANAG